MAARGNHNGLAFKADYCVYSIKWSPYNLYQLLYEVLTHILENHTPEKVRAPEKTACINHSQHPLPVHTLLLVSSIIALLSPLQVKSEAF